MDWVPPRVRWTLLDVPFGLYAVQVTLVLEHAASIRMQRPW